jgi:hypothetical protein
VTPRAASIRAPWIASDAGRGLGCPGQEIATGGLPAKGAARGKVARASSGPRPSRVGGLRTGTGHDARPPLRYPRGANRLGANYGSDLWRARWSLASVRSFPPAAPPLIQSVRLEDDQVQLILNQLAKGNAQEDA